MESKEIYKFSSEDIRFAHDSLVKVRESFPEEESDAFNKIFGRVPTFCQTISDPTDFIKRHGLNLYKGIIEYHHQEGDIILRGKEAQISSRGKKIISEMTEQTFNKSLYKEYDYMKNNIKNYSDY